MIANNANIGNVQFTLRQSMKKIANLVSLSALLMQKIEPEKMNTQERRDVIQSVNSAIYLNSTL